MKKLSFRTVILALIVLLSIPCLAQAHRRVIVVSPPPPAIVVEPPPPPRVVVPAVPLPPPITFAQPPEMLVLPETEVYVVPNVPQDIFFYNGFWWRPWEGRWYRSQYYDRGWGFYQGVPSWYAGVYPGWRDNYRSHMWGGHRWDYHHIPHHDFQRNWRTWHNNGHWRNHQNSGTEGRHHHGGTAHHGGGTHGTVHQAGARQSTQYQGTRHQGAGKAVGKHDR